MDPTGLTQTVSDICNTLYAPGTTLTAYWNGAGLQFTLPSYSAKMSSLAQALTLFPNALPTTDQTVSFLANILFESACLSTKEEAQCVKDPGNCVKLYGDNYWGRGYIQLTGKANYQAFADAIGRQDVVANPGLVASDETLAWASAVWFWKGNCKGASTVGDALMCINSLECSSATSTMYFQFAPVYRLLIAQKLAGAVGVGDASAKSVAVCPQMGTSLETAWDQFCKYHAGTPSESVTCGKPIVVVIGEKVMGGVSATKTMDGSGSTTTTAITSSFSTVLSSGVSPVDAVPTSTRIQAVVSTNSVKGSPTASSSVLMHPISKFLYLYFVLFVN
ncbi:lysozyme-like protein [Rhizoclosmatium globosum]|uniref:Lysozyme-like protein n=1 Tax=Rhizoclosmatium globosum TaxID=329046 RepID=A0A1Y2CBT8_9FUNG|nr:lysozyme-like protein [Rhizoclosmatium globosum]|eukprot:ORY44521.1 lysozyme-like protein [Rhizoclosmatium globosum]